MSSDHVAKKRKTCSCHADYEIEFPRLQSFHKTDRIAVIFKRALLYGRRDERVTV